MHKRVRTVRTSAAAAALAAFFVLTGCGSDDSGDTSKDSATTAPTEAGKGDAAANGDIEGAWTGESDGKKVDLAVTGKKAVLVADGHACTGDVTEMGGEPMLSLKCADGNTDRTMGSIESNDGKTLVISWDAGAKDTLTKSASGKLPEGLPTGLPTDLPTP
ncbi:hypothetical protein [Streptomyces sp. NPDC020681]|uniref:hypothetical protein n=1 Tax=Streptomyces sp. NPDC020681 TaxID=3365083 RepID=UPI003792E64C